MKFKLITRKFYVVAQSSETIVSMVDRVHGFLPFQHCVTEQVIKQWMDYFERKLTQKVIISFYQEIK